MATLQAVLQSRRFNRYKPYGLDRVKEDNIRFVMYWGALGKTEAWGRDFDTIRFLCKFRNEIKLKTGKNAGFAVLLADSHAMMNGIGNAQEYLWQVSNMLANSGFETVLVSSFWKKYGITAEMINGGKEKVMVKSQKLMARLKESASHHFGGDAEEGWKTYYSMRLAEKGMIEREFADCIFLTYNSPDYREILPELPTLYIYADNRGSEPPWLPNEP